MLSDVDEQYVSRWRRDKVRPFAAQHLAARCNFGADVVRAPRAAVSGRKGDLFGAVATAGGEDDVGIAAPPMVLPSMEGRPTGARNESSVLFSLDALKAGFESAPAPTAPLGRGPAGGGRAPA